MRSIPEFTPEHKYDSSQNLSSSLQPNIITEAQEVLKKSYTLKIRRKINEAWTKIPIPHYKKAFKWFSLSAKQGHAEAQCYLGVMYGHGDGVLHNISESVMWLKLSAEQGEPKAQIALGLMYEEGIGITVAQNHLEAARWFKLAADSGHIKAQSKIEEYSLKNKKFCTQCGDLIPLDRLLAAPNAKFCTPCKEQNE